MRWVLVVLVLAACGGGDAKTDPGCVSCPMGSCCPRTDGRDGPDDVVCWWETSKGSCATRAETCFESAYGADGMKDRTKPWVTLRKAACVDAAGECVAFHADNPACCYRNPDATWLGSGGSQPGWELAELNEGGQHPIVETMSCR
jgi:hypothetical protein